MERASVLVTALVALGVAAIARGAEPGASPGILRRMIASLEESRIPELAGSRSRVLRSATHLGPIEHGGERLELAMVQLVKPGKVPTHPGNEGAYLVCFDGAMAIRSHCRLEETGAYLEGALLVRRGKVIGDFSVHDEQTRAQGFLVEGAVRLPYPFRDQE